MGKADYQSDEREKLGKHSFRMKLCEFLRIGVLFLSFSDWSKDCDGGNII